MIPFSEKQRQEFAVYDFIDSVDCSGRLDILLDEEDGVHGSENDINDDIEAPEALIDDLIMSKDFYLIKVELGVLFLEMHGLGQLSTKDWLRSKGQLQKWVS